MQEHLGDKPKAKRGFAAMSAERRREIASSGGTAAHQQGTAHKWNKAEAKTAGQRGGSARGKRKASVRDTEDKEPLL